MTRQESEQGRRRVLERAVYGPSSSPGNRKFVELFNSSPLRLEMGGSLSSVVVAYETWGSLNSDGSNAVLVLHALTGDSHAAGPAESGHPTPGWWNHQIGPGKAIDTDKYFVVCPNVLGGCQGTTGPSSNIPGTSRAYGSQFPEITIRDQVVVDLELSKALGIGRWTGIVGGSMGGMRALEMAIMAPELVDRMLILAATAAASAEQIALCSIQIETIMSDPLFFEGDYYGHGDGLGPVAGMAIARKLAMYSYRSELEFQSRFGRKLQSGGDANGIGNFAIESYLENHAVKLNERFDPNSYVVLSKAMNTHDVARGRASLAEVLSSISVKTFIAGVDSDRLYPLWQQNQLAELIPTTELFTIIHSDFGHDAFLIEADQVAKFISRALA